jgi:hypothetical protein
VTNDFPLRPSFVLLHVESLSKAQLAFDRIIAPIRSEFGYEEVDTAIAKFEFGTVYGAENEFEEFAVVLDLAVDDADEEDFGRFAMFIAGLRAGAAGAARLGQDRATSTAQLDTLDRHGRPEDGER